MNFEKYQQINDEKMNFREMEDADVVSNYRNQGCGDGYRIYLKVADGHILDASYTTTGCGFGMAALAIVTELVKGKTVEEAAAVSTDDINAGLDGFPPRRQNYPVSALEALHQALDDLEQGKGIPADVRAAVKNEALEKLRGGGNWVGENIGAVDLDGQVLDSIDARGVNLSRASLRNTSFRGANLQDANFRGAFLNDADLSGADLTGADLRWCKLSGAKLEGTIVSGALYDAGTRLDPEWIPLFAQMRPAGKQMFVRDAKSSNTTTDSREQ
ncbi:MAG TPA: iron-sulfur cluster assembly scaffold protein [Thermoanaerobaculia bacterium]|nr:iron-sulfur cluster assembly scaffold protein [Thermoanaerobaculia bacterium]